MKHALTLLFMMLCGGAFGQEYHKCTIYQYKGEDSTDKQAVSIKLYNERGKILHETFKNYNYFEGDDTMEIEMNHTYDYYYDDTLLVGNKLVEYEGDTGNFKYFIYNAKKQLVMTIIHAHSHRSIDTTFYVYDATGLRREMNFGHYQRIYDYDGQNRLILDSLESLPITKYVYGKNNSTEYRQIDRYSFDKYENTYDQKGNTIEEDSYHCYALVEEKSDSQSRAHLPDDKTESRTQVMRWASRAEMPCSLWHKDFTEYFPDGRIARKKHWYKGEITTAHVYVYE